MKLLNTLLIIILIAITLLSSCKSDNKILNKKRNTEYLNNDLKPDEFYPAAQVELQIESEGSKMYGFAYTADGEGPHPTVILLHGLPGNERNLDIAQNMRRAGFNVIYFNYRGTWGSEGVFKFQNAIHDAGAVIDYLTDSLNREMLRVDPEKIAFVGHSMGAGFAMLAGINDPRVKSVIGISVFNPYTLLQGDEAKGNLISLKEYLLTLGMLNCNPNQFLNDILEDIDQYNIGEMIEKSNKPILILDEHMNNHSFLKYTQRKNFEYKIWNTDHAFTNRRIALSKEIINWLDDMMLNNKASK